MWAIPRKAAAAARHQAGDCLLDGIKPRDQIEAMLAAQMAAVHVATMTFARRLAHVENIPQQDSAERAFNKLARTFTTQMEALKRYRTGGEQKITVQHVSVGEGGQAIVGNVTQRAPEPHPAVATTPPLALAHSKQAPMPLIEEAERVAVPVAIHRRLPRLAGAECFSHRMGRIAAVRVVRIWRMISTIRPYCLTGGMTCAPSASPGAAGDNHAAPRERHRTTAWLPHRVSTAAAINVAELQICSFYPSVAITLVPQNC
jgi:hypothetical protein